MRWRRRWTSPPNRVTAILKGQRGITDDAALRLARYFGTTPELWMNLQRTFDLRSAEGKSGAKAAASARLREAAERPRAPSLR